MVCEWCLSCPEARTVSDGMGWLSCCIALTSAGEKHLEHLGAVIYVGRSRRKQQIRAGNKGQIVTLRLAAELCGAEGRNAYLV